MTFGKYFKLSTFESLTERQPSTVMIRVLTGSKDAIAYWRKLKQCLSLEEDETVTNCHGLKMEAIG